MKYTKKCECCGHQISAYTHALNFQLVQALEQIVKYYEQKGKGCNLQKNLNLTKNQYNNFQKLQYFDLVRNTDEGWYPTLAGTAFIKGEIAVENPVATFGKDILHKWHEAWQTAEKKPRPTHVSQVKGYVWKGREEYKEEKSSTLF